MPDFYLQSPIVGGLTVPHDAAFNVGVGDFSISIWLKDCFNFNVNYISIFKGGFLAPNYTISYYAAGQYLYLRIEDSIGYVNVPIPIPLDTAGWQHIIFTCDRDGLCTPYLNGVAGTPVDISAISGSLDNMIDFNIDGFGGFDDFRLYKSVLSAEKVGVIYNFGHGKKYSIDDANEAAAVAFHFDEGSGATTIDTVAGLVGTLTTFLDGTPATFWMPGGIPLSWQDITIADTNKKISELRIPVPVNVFKGSNL